MGLCGTWVDEATVAAVCPGYTSLTLTAEVLDRWTLAASEILYGLSGRQFPGVCVDEVRPCSTAAGQMLSYGPGLGARPLPVESGCRCPLRSGCSCTVAAVRLPHTPVRRVLAVTVNGAVLAPGSYRLVDRRELASTFGGWPSVQNLGAPVGAPGTWSVEYEYGTLPPAGGAEAAALLGFELARGCAGDDDCRLPRRVQSVTREGISMTVIDPFDFLTDGRTGLYEVDTWLRSVNPTGASRPGKVIDVGAHRVR